MASNIQDFKSGKMLLILPTRPAFTNSVSLIQLNSRTGSGISQFEALFFHCGSCLVLKG